jgi:5-methylcytosine-specific restriction endonuclease McrA
MPTKKQIEFAWENAKSIRGKDPDVWRKDSYDNKIRKGSFGTEGNYGWEVDHKHPKDKGDTESLHNIRALHWKENRKKGDTYPYKR